MLLFAVVFLIGFLVLFSPYFFVSFFPFGFGLVGGVIMAITDDIALSVFLGFIGIFVAAWPADVIFGPRVREDVAVGDEGRLTKVSSNGKTADIRLTKTLSEMKEFRVQLQEPDSNIRIGTEVVIVEKLRSKLTVTPVESDTEPTVE